jgi:hypothetical protein
MYNYIAQQIQLQEQTGSGGIDVPGGTSSKIYFWYSQAGAINANDTNDPAAVFIRDAGSSGKLGVRPYI